MLEDFHVDHKLNMVLPVIQMRTSIRIPLRSCNRCSYRLITVRMNSITQSQSFRTVSGVDETESS